MKSRILPLLLAVLVLATGLAPHVCVSGEALTAKPLAPASDTVEAAVPSCHAEAGAAPAVRRGGPAAASSDPAPSDAPDRDGCCGGVAGAFCQHACQTAGVVALTGFARPAVLSAGLAEPGVDSPAAPPISGPDHVPLA
jgi:hypothetical protein